ncbi:MAG: glycosyltransferase family 39 protein, partial [Patescibacteria group bacterium]
MKYPRSRTQNIALIGLLLAISLATRTLNLGTFLTADEKTWLGRSYEFIRAFKDVRFNDMLQTTHPGVTTLWTAGIAVTTKMFVSGVPFTNATLFHFIKSAQFSIAFLNACAVPVIYIFLYALLKRRDIAFFAALLIALNPLLIGYSRVVHVDALLGSLLTLAVLASMLYARSLERQWLIASAVLSALALLTKIPAVFILPFIVCALIVYYVIPAREPESRQSTTWIPGQARDDIRLFLINRFRDALIWLLIVTLMILIIWPALLWVPNPVGNVLAVKRDISVAATTPHNMSEDYSLNPYHYPAALLSRSTPVSLIGTILGLIAIAVSYKK